MAEVGVWQISGAAPQRFQRGTVDLEKHLEEWIEHDPSMLQAGLSIVGRQVHIGSGILDLLGIDGTGRWAIIEIKRGNISPDTSTQAMVYASHFVRLAPTALKKIVSDYLDKHHQSLQTFLDQNGFDESLFSADERAISIFLVGTGRDPNLDDLLEFVHLKAGEIFAINFDVFENLAGERLLLRTLTDLDVQQKAQPAAKPSSEKTQPEVEELLALAAQNGIGEPFKLIYDAAMKCGLYPHRFKWSIMYAPADHRNRTAVFTRVKAVRGKLQTWVVPQAIAEFYPISEREVVQIVGPSGRRLIDVAEAKTLAASLIKLFRKIADNS